MGLEMKFSSFSIAMNKNHEEFMGYPINEMTLFDKYIYVDA